ncbi:MAG TPA: twin-arginine translocase TatA/TatE family subunit [Deltaproteobacteria bacterium]|nr:twin-arginine translocase TatA/TatE family subunit [Deltaproteobacteria bacterium]HOM27951.1 twin-arginine translocase TatA/TatE family subunit [Deltaproteobacteria bacterium]HPP80787.1 twin-arginine translocase TatA/TatE family subunit [Deltaproteobacteria bacterium]
MFGGLGMTELIIILLIVLVIFGAGKLPEVGSALGKGIKNFKSAISDSGDKTPKADLEDKTKEGQPKG